MTGLWFGEGGIAKPSGIRPRLCDLAPGIGGRRRGAGVSEDIVEKSARTVSICKGRCRAIPALIL